MAKMKENKPVHLVFIQNLIPEINQDHQPKREKDLKKMVNSTCKKFRSG